MRSIALASFALLTCACQQSSLNRESQSDTTRIASRSDSIVVPPISDTAAELRKPYLPPGFIPPWGVTIHSSDAAILLLSVDINKAVPVKTFILNSANDTVRTLAEGSLTPGRWKFNLSKSKLPPGVYNVVLSTPEGERRAEFSVGP